MMMVAAADHPLARRGGAIPTHDLSEHVQLVSTDRSNLTQGREFGVMSPRIWRLANLGAKHAFLRAGLGWGAVPEHLVADDLAGGALVELVLEDGWPRDARMAMLGVHLHDWPPGPAGRWLMERLSSRRATVPAE